MNLAESEKETIIEICKANDISYCALFGSYARGEAEENSDIDLLVRFSKPKGFDWIDAALEIEDELGRKVDLVTESALSPYLKDHVLRDLKVLYEQ